LASLAEGKDHSIEYRIIRSDNGQEVWIEDRVHCEKNKNGAPIRVAGVMIDVSHRKVSEERLRQYARDLENAKELAESANRAKSQFLANMSHEIRTPLGVILGFAELLQDTSLTETERKQSLETIQRNGDILSKVINEILDLSRIESNKLNLEICSFSLRPLLEELKIFFFFQTQDKGLTLEIHVEDYTPSELQSDPTRLKQILVNLIGNAIKFTENGGVTIRARKSKILSDGVDLLIQDTGPGIDANYVNDLFQPFSQLDMTMTRKYGGSGLGLAIAKRYANALGGNVSLFETEKGVGTTFIVTLPIHAPEKTDSDSEASNVKTE
jgi:signal transduction histidine kinase